MGVAKKLTLVTITCGTVLGWSIANGENANGSDSAAATTTQAQQASADSARTANQNASYNEIPEIVVTAEKREQSINDVGLTVTAVSAQQLQSAGVTDISDLPRFVSGFSASRSNDDVPVFTIRGIGFNAVQLSAAPTVSAYVDEAPWPYLAMTGGTMLDLERVEVLKGPQGTLFGNNSTGGSINFIAAKPTSDFSAGFHSTYDRFGQIFVEGFVSIPISDTFGVRIAANTTQDGAWQHTYTPGPYLKNGNADKGAERIIADWRPNSKLTVSLNLNAYYNRSDPQFSQLGLAAPSGGQGSAIVVPPYGSISTYPLPPHDDRDVDFASDPSIRYGRDDNFYQSVLHVDYDISNWLKLTSISNYAHLDTAVHFPIDGTRINIIEGGHTGDIKTYGEELRLSGDFPDQRLHTIVGVNYSKDEINEDEDYQFDNFSIVPPGFHFNPRGGFTSETSAAFANADWDISQQLTLTAGARYTDVKQMYDGCFADDGDGTTRLFQGGIANEFLGAFGLPPTAAYNTAKCLTIGPAPEFLPFEFLAHNTEDNASWRVGLNYKPTSDLLIYGLLSRGYKAGAYPFLFPIVSAQYSRVRQEELTDYETGIKFNPNRKVSLSGAVFYYDYANKQVYADQPVPFLGPAQTLLNIPKSNAYGTELEATVVPINRLTLHGAATFTHTAITDPGALTLDGFGNSVDFRGKPFAYSPKWSAVFSAEYRMPIAGGLDAVLGMDGLYNSVAYGDSSATAAFKLDAYTVLNARLGVESHDGWSVTGWVHNLGNTYYWTSVNFAGDGYERTTGLPLNFGIAVSYKY
jgi:iron complex outermembrane recepter protein